MQVWGAKPSAAWCLEGTVITRSPWLDVKLYLESVFPSTLKKCYFVVSVEKSSIHCPPGSYAMFFGDVSRTF